MSDYTIEVKHGENGWLVGQLKEKPNVLSQGKNWEELLVNLAEAFKLVQEVENEIE
ncbi:MAG TPA: type II toxin-antitoxin system HicB family antitoxin [Bacteroidales bacterium]|nr:type II toxin-antitoxin system HicB family antitoxin [Bacteroidales bacterium]